MSFAPLKIVTRLLLVLLLFLLIINIALILFLRGTQRRIERANDVWTALAPSVLRINDIQVQMVALREVAGELAGWAGTRIPFGNVLAKIEGHVPDSLDLTHVIMRESKDEVLEESPTGRGTVFTPFRVFSLQLEGTTRSGRRGDDIATCSTDLAGDAEIHRFFPTMLLQGIAPRKTAADEQPRVDFAISGQSDQRKWK